MVSLLDITHTPGNLIARLLELERRVANLERTAILGRRFGAYEDDNYAEFEDDGTLVFEGDATTWNDVNVGAMLLDGLAADLPDIDTFDDEGGVDTGIATYAFAIGEKVSGSLELPHWYDEGEDVTFHVHWQGKTAPAGGTDNVNWQLSYIFTGDDVTLDAVTTLPAETAFTTQYEVVRTDFTAIDGTALRIGMQFLFVLERIAASADDYAGDALVMTVGLHVPGDTIGSRAITTK